MGILFLVALTAPALCIAYELARRRFHLCGVEAVLGAVTLLAAWTVVEFWALSGVGGVTRSGHAVATLVFVAAGVLSARGLPVGRCLREGWRLARPLLGGGAGLPARLAAWLTGAWLAWALLALLVLPPLSGDAMNYHLPKVVRWIQHGRLLAYEGGDLRQVTSPCNGEIFVLAHCLPTLSDVLCELPQYEALIVAMLTGLATVRRLGVRGRACAWVALMVLSAPVLLVQSYAAKNDIVFGAFAALAGLWGLRVAQGQGRGSWVLFLLSVGLFAGTKIHGVLVGLPFVLLILPRALPRAAAAMGLALLLSPVLFLLAFPVYLRNWLLFGSPAYYTPETAVVIAPGGASFLQNIRQWADWLWWTGLDYRSWSAFDHTFAHFGAPFGYLLAGALVWSALGRGERPAANAPAAGNSGARRALVLPVGLSVLMIVPLLGPSGTTPRHFLYVPLLLMPVIVRSLSLAGRWVLRTVEAALLPFAIVAMGGAVTRDSVIIWRAPTAMAGERSCRIVYWCAGETLRRGGDFLSVAEFLGARDGRETYGEMGRRFHAGDRILLALGREPYEYPAHGKAFDRRVRHLRGPGDVPAPFELGGAHVWLLWDVRFDAIPREWYEPAYTAHRVYRSQLELWELVPAGS